MNVYIYTNMYITINKKWYVRKPPIVYGEGWERGMGMGK